MNLTAEILEEFKNYLILEEKSAATLDKYMRDAQCHLVRPNFVKLRGKSSGLPLKNIFGNNFPIKLSNFEKWKFIENLWTSMRFGGII